MPRIQSSVKDVRKNRAQRQINRTRLSALKTILRKTRALSPASLPAALPVAYQAIDKAAQGGLIHKNAAARYKSRLARKKSPVAASKAAV